jgi:hypothetical protein
MILELLEEAKIPKAYCTLEASGKRQSSLLHILSARSLQLLPGLFSINRKTSGDNSAAGKGGGGKPIASGFPI